MSKEELRSQALKSRRAIPSYQLASLSEEVRRRVVSLPEVSDAKIVATYVAKPDEVQTSGIIEDLLSRGKSVLVPRAEPSTGRLTFTQIHSMSELSVGHFGVLEPDPAARAVPLQKAGVVLVPIVAWDERGRRIGYGKGYFDRALGSGRSPVSIGLALESQRAEGIPMSSSDVPLDAVVTEARILRFERGNA